MPFYFCTLRTSLPPEAVEERLAKATRPFAIFPVPTWARIRRYFETVTVPPDPATPAFIGAVQRDGFRIQRAILYRNSFLPMMWGRVVGDARGSDIRVLMTLHPLLWIAYIIGLGLWIVHALHPEARVHSMNALMAAAVLGITLVGFVPEALIARKKLDALLAATTGNAAR